MVTTQLTEYVTSARQKGFADTDIRNALISAGWLPADADEALKSNTVNSTPISPVEEKPYVPAQPTADPVITKPADTATAVTPTTPAKPQEVAITTPPIQSSGTGRLVTAQVEPAVTSPITEQPPDLPYVLPTAADNLRAESEPGNQVPPISGQPATPATVAGIASEVDKSSPVEQSPFREPPVTEPPVSDTPPSEAVKQLAGIGVTPGPVSTGSAITIKTPSPANLARTGVGVVVAGVLVSLYIFIKNNEPPKPSVQGASTLTSWIRETPQPPAPTIQPASDAGIYSSTQDGFSFRHYLNWTVETNEKTTIVVSPHTKESDLYKQYGFGDAIVSTVAYQDDSISTDESAKNLATSLSTDNKTVSSTINTLPAYESLTDTPEGSTSNIVVAGKNRMLVIQFPYTKGRAQLSEGQKMILESLTEI